MSENTEENFGKIIYKGKLIDIENMSIEEREKIIDDLESECEELENKIDTILDVNNVNN